MATFHRRLRNLEAELLDASGLVPNSPPWHAYWKARFDEYMAGDGSTGLKDMPLDVLCLNMRNAPDSE